MKKIRTNSAPKMALSMIKCGLRARLWTLPAAMVTVFIVLWFLRGDPLPDGVGNTLSAGIFLLFRGDKPFTVSAVWLSVNAFIAFTLRTFPIENSMLCEQKTLLGVVSRRRWWTAKFITMTALVTFEFLAIYSAAIAFSAVVPNSAVIGAGGLALGEHFFGILLAPWLTSLAVSSAQILINSVTKPIIGLAAVMGYLTASAYYYSPIMIGNCSILQRSGFVMSGGIRLPAVAAVTLSVMAVCYLLGLTAVEKIDLI